MDWDRVFAGYKAQVDWPGARFWRELAAHFQNAKVILSVRSSESWFKSAMNTIYPVMANHASLESADRRARARMAYQIIVEQIFDRRMDDPEHAMAVFQRHNEEVKSSIPAERLLVYEAGQGWEPLCRFLGVAVPETPYPKTNSTRDFNNDRPLPDAKD